MLKAINISLASICGADCLFCPNDKGEKNKIKIMPYEYAEKIINEISSASFRAKHRVGLIEVGENGDAFLNKDLIKILRLIKSKLPDMKVELYTNFQNFTKDKAETILREKLVDSFWCDMDAADARNYYDVKKLDLAVVKNNLKNFLDLRKKLGSDATLGILVLTLNHYITTIHRKLGRYPAKLKDAGLGNMPDDFLAVKKEYERLLDGKADKIVRSGIVGWAEREAHDINNKHYAEYRCPNLYRVVSEVFIAPDGSWYACCLDSKNELVFGNVVKESIDEVYRGRKRKELISMLRKREFTKIGSPCKTIACCQRLDDKIENPLTVIKKLFIAYTYE